MLQLNDREPRENRGRLRHCNGIQTPTATEPEIGIGKAGARLNPKSGYRFSRARRGCHLGSQLLRQREGWDQLAELFL